tara:strand:+ start:174 stop:506 length:333 start_codon:yes stop_codon:yes gene_type:complete
MAKILSNDALKLFFTFSKKSLDSAFLVSLSDFVLRGVNLEKGVSFEANRRGGFLNLRRVLAFKIALRYPEKGACRLTGNLRKSRERYFSITDPNLRGELIRAFIVTGLAS